MKKIIFTTAFIIAAITLVMPAMALTPSADYKTTPDKFGMKFEEKMVPTSDGASLNTWYFEAAKKTSNTIVISGSGDGNMGDNLEIVSQFLSMGYNVMTYDYRGYGKSSAFTFSPIAYIVPQFITDLNSVLDYVRKSHSITKFDLYGIGVGAGLSIGVGYSRTETRKIIADAPWPSIEGMRALIKAKEKRPTDIPVGFDKNIEPQYALEKTKPYIKGVLIIISQNDPLLGPSDMKVLSKGTEMYVVKESKNNADNFSANKDSYFKQIKKFMAN